MMREKKIKKNLPARNGKKKEKSKYSFTTAPSKKSNKDRELRKIEEELLVFSKTTVIYIPKYIHYLDNIILNKYNKLLLKGSKVNHISDSHWYNYGNLYKCIHDSSSANGYYKGLEYKRPTVEYYASVDKLEVMFLDYLSNTLGRKRINHTKAKSCVLWFVKHLYIAVSLGNKGFKYYRDKNKLRSKQSDVPYRMLLEIVDMLDHYNLITNLKGYHIDDTFKACSMIILQKEVVDALNVPDKVDYTPEYNKNHEVTIVRRKEGKIKVDIPKEEYKEDWASEEDYTEQVLNGYNKLIATSKVEINGYLIPELYLSRIFMEDISSYGRVFDQGQVQTKPKNIRKMITIDGVPTVSLDCKSLHPRICYELEGIQLSDDFDPYYEHTCDLDTGLIEKFKSFYNIDQYNPVRNLSKIILLCLINSNDIPTAIKATRNKMFMDSNKANTNVEHNMKYIGLPADCMKDNYLESFTEGLLEHNKEIRKYLGTGMGGRLQNLDSKIIMDCLDNLEKKSIITLPVHDALICKVVDKWVVEEQMYRSYEKVVGDMNCLIEQEY